MPNASFPFTTGAKLYEPIRKPINDQNCLALQVLVLMLLADGVLQETGLSA